MKGADGAEAASAGYERVVQALSALPDGADFATGYAHLFNKVVGGIVSIHDYMSFKVDANKKFVSVLKKRIAARYCEADGTPTYSSAEFHAGRNDYTDRPFAALRIAWGYGDDFHVCQLECPEMDMEHKFSHNIYHFTPFFIDRGIETRFTFDWRHVDETAARIGTWPDAYMRAELERMIAEVCVEITNERFMKNVKKEVSGTALEGQIAAALDKGVSAGAKGTGKKRKAAAGICVGDKVLIRCEGRTAVIKAVDAKQKLATLVVDGSRAPLRYRLEDLEIKMEVNNG